MYVVIVKSLIVERFLRQDGYDCKHSESAVVQLARLHELEVVVDRAKDTSYKSTNKGNFSPRIGEFRLVLDVGTCSMSR